MMDGRIFVAGLFLLCGAATPAPAYSGLDCKDLKEAVDVLTDLEIAVFFADEIDDEDDELLRFITVIVRDAADEEGDRKLVKAADKMRRAYNSRDLADFETGLERVVDRLEAIREDDC